MVNGLSRRAFVVFASCVKLLAQTQSEEDSSLPDAPFELQAGWHPLLSGHDLTGWHAEPQAAEWFTTHSVSWRRIESPTTLIAKPEPGPIVINGPTRRTSNLVTDARFGDVELYLEFLIPKGSNSGVYLHGLYEVQIFDSWDAQVTLGAQDAGAIYERWENGRGFEGSAPLLNASRPPGQWQSYHIWFRAPRFESGRKVSDAEFVKVVYNGLVVQRHAHCTGPTRSALQIPEAPVNPILLQGDHGPVAFRNIHVREMRTASVVFK